MMPHQDVISREYKIMLRASHFLGDENTLRHSANAFWHDFTKTIRPIALDDDGRLHDIEKRRRIRFYDTSAHRLRQNAYILRDRINENSQERELTLKFRHPDRYMAQDRDMTGTEGTQSKSKFEEDIKPPFETLYSFSSQQRLSRDKKLNQMDDPGRLYPGLPAALDVYDPDEPLVVVGNFTARELVLEGAEFQIGKSPKIEAECALVVWYDADGNAQRPVLVEFSFRYEPDHEQHEGVVAERAYKAFELLQDKAMSHWVDEASKTKTAFAYS